MSPIFRVSGGVFATVLLGVLFLMVPDPLCAQSVRGTVVEEQSGIPVVGAVVVLIDEQDQRRRGVLTDDTGAFHLVVPEAGRYRLRTERIGYATTTSAPFQLQAAQVLQYRLAISSSPVDLVGIQVTSRRRCSLRPEQGLQTHLLWEEVRKALTATAITQDEQLLRVRLLRYEREMDARGNEIRRERTWTRSGVVDNPFVSVPLEELAQHGYVRAEEEGTLYHAPDAHVLLSDAFLDTHCFRAVEGRDPDLIGLSFEPHRSRRVPDIRGVLWVDRSTRELRHLEYRYTALPAAIRTGTPGGRVDFQRLATGQWIVRRWWIRMPLTEVHETAAPSGNQRRYVLAGLKEDGGEVMEAISASGSFLFAPGQATLAGVVFDSTRNAALAGATVFLPGTTHAATTDSQGRFTLPDLPEGNHSVAFRHPRADSLGAPMLMRNVTLHAGATAEVQLAIPSATSLLTRVCTAEQQRAGARAIVGVVRVAGSGQPAAGAEVTLNVHQVRSSGGHLRRTTESSVVVTDAEGRYQSCIRSDGGAISATAVLEGRRSREVQVPPTGLFTYQALEVPRAPLAEEH